jgi:hypothetical protein
MTTTVTFYDDFIGFDLTAMFESEVKLALIASSYTFSSAHASFTTDIAPDESSGSGYAEVDYVQMQRSGSGGAGETDYEFGSGVVFPTMTIADWRYLVLYDVATDAPILCIDSGTTNSLTAQGLLISGTVFKTTF